MTVSVSENPFRKITDRCVKPIVIVCGCCGGFATHRMDREEFGVIIRSHYCMPCFDNQDPSTIAIDEPLMSGSNYLRTSNMNFSEKPEENPEPPIDKPDPTEPVKVANLRVFRY